MSKQHMSSILRCSSWERDYLLSRCMKPSTHFNSLRKGRFHLLWFHTNICRGSHISCQTDIRDIFLTHRGRVTHICVGYLTIIGSDNGLSPGRRQAIIWTNASILFIGPLGTNFSEISIEMLTFSFKKMRLKVSSAKWRPFCLGLNVLKSGVI